MWPGEGGGRVVHESIFTVTEADIRCPSTQQGYSPFRMDAGLAWILCGIASN